MRVSPGGLGVGQRMNSWRKPIRSSRSRSMRSSSRRFSGSIGKLQLVRTHPDANGSDPRRKAIDHHRQVGEAVNRALVPSRLRTRQTLGGCGMEGETTMTKQPRGPRLGKLDLTRRTILAGAAAVVLVPTYWRQASAQEKRILIR